MRVGHDVAIRIDNDPGDSMLPDDSRWGVTVILRGTIPATTIWTTAGETRETTVSRELSKALSNSDVPGVFDLTATAPADTCGTVDCA